jgi:hypothetical protein
MRCFLPAFNHRDGLWFVFVLSIVLFAAGSGMAQAGLYNALFYLMDSQEDSDRPPVEMFLDLGYTPQRQFRNRPRTEFERRELVFEFNSPIAGKNGWGLFTFLHYSRMEDDYEYAVAYPEHREKASLGLFGLAKLSEKWVFAGVLQVATQRAGADLKDSLVYQPTVGAAYALSDRSFLLAMVNYSNFRGDPDLDHLPVGGVMYLARLSPRFTMIAGFPFNGFRWTLHRKLTLQMHYMPIANFDLALAWQPLRRFEVTLRYERGSDAYFTDGDKYGGERLFFDYAATGLEFYLRPVEWMKLGLRAQYRTGDNSYVSDEATRKEAVARQDLERELRYGLVLFVRL